MELAWLLGFWGFFALLAALEFRLASPSSKPDRATRWPSNIGLGLLNGALVSLLPIGTVLAAGWAEAQGFGLLRLIDVPWWAVALATILLRSLFQYAFHRLAHTLTALWSLHRVHHCDTHLDGSTGLRFHPLEALASVAFISPLVVFAGLDPTTLLLFEVFEIIIGIFSHTSITLPAAIERILRPVFMTPGLHRLHHSNFTAEAQHNFGAALSLWDRLFGSYLAVPLARPQPRPFAVGVEGIASEQAADFGWLLWSPLTLPRNNS